MQVDLQSLLNVERRRADQLATVLREAQDERHHKVVVPIAEKRPVYYRAVPAQALRPSFAAEIRRQQQDKQQAERKTERNNLHETMRTELYRIGAIVAPPPRRPGVE
jgi:predicted nucleic acid-binding Zn ribbon protein